MISFKSFITLAAAGLTAYAACAYTVERETMKVELNDGTTREINVADIASVKFVTSTETVGFELTDGDQTLLKSESVASMFRAVPTEDGQSTYFAFGAAEAETVAGLREQPYAVEIQIPATSLYAGDVDLTAELSATVTLYKYEDGAVSEIWTSVSEGTLTTRRDVRANVTLELECTFEDGPTLYASYKGKPTDVESVADINPAPTYSNEIVYFNLDGDIAYHDVITGVSTRTSSGRKKFTFELEKGYYDCILEVSPDLFGKGVIDMSTAPSNSIRFNYGYTIQLSSPNPDGRFVPKNATILVNDNGDGTWTIEADVTNYYTSTLTGEGGTPERVILQYTGAID